MFRWLLNDRLTLMLAAFLFPTDTLEMAEWIFLLIPVLKRVVAIY